MKLRINSGLILVVLYALVAGCASSGMNNMTVTTYDGKSGNYETKLYSKYYDAADWIMEGKLGIQVAIDHEKDVNPALHALQQATGTLGPDDLAASGIVTLYFVNLEQRDISVEVLSVTTNRGKEKATTAAQTVIAKARARTRLSFGSIPIYNYATEINIKIEYRIADSSKTQEFIVKRLTIDELNRYFGTNGRPPYPWFQAPYFPFEPPMRVLD